MLLARRFEERVFKLRRQGKLLGSIHLSLGEEAAAAGTILALQKDDYILPTHRGHAQMLAKGARPEKMLAELGGKSSGYCKGRGGSIHIFDKDTGNLGANGIVGAQFPIAAGIGFAIRYQGSDRCLICFAGDGATNQGWFYESLNVASLMNLPIFYVIVNNMWGMGTRSTDASLAAVPEKAALFKIKSDKVDGNDAIKVYGKAVDMLKWVRKKHQPALLECETYRMGGHSIFDNRPYRPPAEIEIWKKRDCLKRHRAVMQGRKIKSARLKEIEEKVDRLLHDAETYAFNSEDPRYDPSIEM
jgi:pyruvate dehydrogenase E1 component alpha subunit